MTTRYLLLATHVPVSGSRGGVVRYTVALAEALARRPDVELHVLVTRDAADFFTRFLPSGRVHRVRPAPTPVLALREWLAAVRVLRSGRFDVVHGPKHIVPRRAHRAIRVLTVHDMLLLDRARDFGAAKRLLLRTPYRDSLRRADVVIGVSRATRARILDHHPGVRVQVVPLAASAALLAASGEPVEALRDKRFALVVGDAGIRKNLALAVRTWPRIRERVPDAVLVVVGPQPWGRESHGGAEWDRLLAAGAVVQLRDVPDGTLRWCYEHAAVVLCPSLIEGFGLPAVEAAAFGTPVVTSDDPATCEAVAGWGQPSAAWSRADWVATVVGALQQPSAAGGVDPARRSWDDVAAETLAAVSGTSVSGASVAEPADGGGSRVGVSPFRAPLRVLHVAAAGRGGAVEELVAGHRDSGWKVEVVEDGGIGVDLDGVDVDLDVVVLHGLRAGRLRRRIRGRVPTVLLAGRERPRWSREVALARFTNVLVLPPDAGRGWRRVAAPVTRWSPAGPWAAEELAEILVRARAWGGGPGQSWTR